jgi:nickel/cobalt transporter (NiCoT) family protein
MMAETFSISALGLVFLLGLRHGLDPDHVAVIDNLTFLALDERPGWAAWTGTFFAIGHSLSVTLVALGVAWASGQFMWPGWIVPVVDVMIVALLLLVGLMNLRALLTPGNYTPVGWRQKLVPARLRTSSHPLAVIGVGMIFGLVFDTATQAAAWGTVAASGGGMVSALLIATCFALGMILTDTADSQIVVRLLRRGRDPQQVQRYRRRVGWTIVAMSFGMAAYALAGMIDPQFGLGDFAYTGIGVTMAGIVMLLVGWRFGSPAEVHDARD